MTEKILVCAIVLFMLTFGFCLAIGVLLKFADKKDDFVKITTGFICVACVFFAFASFLGTVIMAVFFIQSLFGY